MIELPTTLLTTDEENKLAKKRTEDNRNKLVLHAMREAMAYAHQCCRGKIPQDDLFSLAYDALSKAAKNFSPNRIRFFAYAKVYVRREIAAWWKRQDVVKNSSRHAEDILPVSKMPDARATELDCEYQGGPGIHNPDLENSMELIVDPEYDMMRIRELFEEIKPILETKLTKSEQLVIDLYYNGDIDFTQIGKILGRTRQRAQGLHREALKKIRSELMRRKLMFATGRIAV